MNQKEDSILLVSPFAWGENVYPHLYEFKINMEKHFDVHYFHFPERGYWIEDLVSNLKANKFSKKGYRPFYTIYKSVLELYKIKKQQKNKKVIAIDNFIYVVCCFVFGSRNVVLWSHDFVARDNKSRDTILQKIIRKRTRKNIKKSLLVIQTEERKKFFLRSLDMEGATLDTFYLPVCLNKIDDLKFPRSLERIKPNVMQVGPINESRSNSVTIAKYFNYDVANLYLHGFITDEFKKEIDSPECTPVLSPIHLKTPELPSFIHGLCDVGIVSYNATDENFYHVAASSCQLAEFITVYKPVLSYGDNTLTDFVNEKQLGLGIRNISELNDAIKRITENYSLYVGNIESFLKTDFNLMDYTNKFCDIIHARSK